MAERKAQNKYYPPDWDPSKGSLNQYHGQHPLRERAKKIGEGILVIRFEMPFNVWCLSCHKHIGKGTRYNAEKKSVGHYFTTSIYEFTMRCVLCGGRMVIRTDPEHGEYMMVSGIKRKTEIWDHVDEDMNNFNLLNDEQHEKVATNPLAKLEQAATDVSRAAKSKPQLEQLIDLQHRMKDDVALLKVARAQNRTARHQCERETNEAAQRWGAHSNMRMQTLNADEDQRAHQTLFQPRKTLSPLHPLHSMLDEHASHSSSASSTSSTSSSSSSSSLSSSSSHPAQQQHRAFLQKMKRQIENGLDPSKLKIIDTASSSSSSSSSLSSSPFVSTPLRAKKPPHNDHFSSSASSPSSSSSSSSSSTSTSFSSSSDSGRPSKRLKSSDRPRSASSSSSFTPSALASLAAYDSD